MDHQPNQSINQSTSKTPQIQVLFVGVGLVSWLIWVSPGLDITSKKANDEMIKKETFLWWKTFVENLNLWTAPYFGTITHFFLMERWDGSERTISHHPTEGDYGGIRLLFKNLGESWGTQKRSLGGVHERDDGPEARVVMWMKNHLSKKKLASPKSVLELMKTKGNYSRFVPGVKIRPKILKKSKFKKNMKI